MENREILLRAAIEVTKLRNNQYGDPNQDFKRISGMLNALGFQLNGEILLPHDVALIMGCLKLSRLSWNPEKQDSWVDLAGYAACGYDCAAEEQLFAVPDGHVDDSGPDGGDKAEDDDPRHDITETWPSRH